MLRHPARSILAALGLAAMLAGCGSIGSHVPGVLGGEPADTPARPATAYSYPAVHDMPPPRADAPMSDEQQAQMEKELTSAREKQEAAVKAEAVADAAQNSPAPAPKKPPPKKTARKKPPASASRGEATGTTTNP
jgi:hypothetical protein